MDELLKDSRFAHIPKDPKFRRIPKHERKVKIDKRFKSMFKNKNFTVKYTIDKRGRPVNTTSSEDLKKYYELSSSSDDSENDADNEKVTCNLQTESSKKKLHSKVAKHLTNISQQSKINKKKNLTSKKSKQQTESGSFSENEEADNGDESKSDKSINSEEDDAFKISDTEEANNTENRRQLNIVNENENKKLDKNIKEKLRDLTIDYARGEGILLSDSSSEEESSEEEDDDDEISHNWGELDKEAETTDEITSRLAACNMDWDRIRAVDLMVLFNSFLPPSGLIHSVKIYPSEFGKQRMKDEEIKGPIELSEKQNTTDNFSDNDDEEGSQYHMEKMRQYQLNRLKYYYAVITCDCPATANKIYTECDGIEYESTATKFDLRFIPEDMTFDDEPREVCDNLPDLEKYQPRQFTTTALQQVKVELTWDETNPERMEITKKLNSGKIDDVNQNDINAYLASGTSDDESVNDEDDKKDDDVVENNDKNPIEKYRSLLKSIEEKEEEEKKKKLELELTWDVGAQEKAEKLIKEKMKHTEQMTPFEKYLDKRREKKKAKKDKKNNLPNGDEVNDEVESDSDDSIPSDVDMNDPYFAEEMKNVKKSKKKLTPNSDKNDKLNSSDEEKAKAELELLMLDSDDEKDKHHFNMKAIEDNEMLTKSKKKRLSKKQKIQKKSAVEDNFKVDVNDSRFSALFTSHHYNIDPADPHYRNTSGTTTLINEQLKRRGNKIMEEEVPTKQTKSNDTLNSDLAALVKAVKKNTKNNISKRIK